MSCGLQPGPSGALWTPSAWAQGVQLALLPPYPHPIPPHEADSTCCQGHPSASRSPVLWPQKGLFPTERREAGWLRISKPIFPCLWRAARQCPRGQCAPSYGSHTASACLGGGRAPSLASFSGRSLAASCSLGCSPGTVPVPRRRVVVPVAFLMLSHET